MDSFFTPLIVLVQVAKLTSWLHYSLDKLSTPLDYFFRDDAPGVDGELTDDSISF